MEKIEELLSGVESALEAVSEALQYLSDFDWTPTDGFLPIIRRAILIRQFDSLHSILEMVRASHGHAAVPQLRPACEELIWITYLNSIPVEDAEDMLIWIGARELQNRLHAQDDYAGRAVTKELGLFTYLNSSNRRKKVTSKKIRSLGKKLGWEEYVVEKAQLPSVAWLAEKTGRTRFYNFLYAATSRFVHFSPSELFRLAWGKSGRISIRSIHFRDYLSAFALSWGFRLFLDTLTELVTNGGLTEIQIDEQKFLAAAEQIGRFKQVPIITAEELAWPKDA